VTRVYVDDEAVRTARYQITTAPPRSTVNPCLSRCGTSSGMWTPATLLMVAFMLFASVQNALDSDFSNAERTRGGVVFGIGALAVLVGMWLLREGREGRATPVAYTLIIVPVLFPGVVFFWMLLIPTILATVIIVGVLSGRLGRELQAAEGTLPPTSSL
jgi:hypothetical protein